MGPATMTVKSDAEVRWVRVASRSGPGAAVEVNGVSH